MVLISLLTKKKISFNFLTDVSLNQYLCIYKQFIYQMQQNFNLKKIYSSPRLSYCITHKRKKKMQSNQNITIEAQQKPAYYLKDLKQMCQEQKLQNNQKKLLSTSDLLFPCNYNGHKINKRSSSISQRMPMKNNLPHETNDENKFTKKNFFPFPRDMGFITERQKQMDKTSFRITNNINKVKLAHQRKEGSIENDLKFIETHRDSSKNHIKKNKYAKVSYDILIREQSANFQKEIKSIFKIFKNEDSKASFYEIVKAQIKGGKKKVNDTTSSTGDSFDRKSVELNKKTKLDLVKKKFCEAQKQCHQNQSEGYLLDDVSNLNEKNKPNNRKKDFFVVSSIIDNLKINPEKNPVLKKFAIKFQEDYSTKERFGLQLKFDC